MHRLHYIHSGTYNGKFLSENQSSADKNRKRGIIWFNPPYSKSVSSNVGKCFLKLIEKHLPKHHKFWKLFNGNTVKVSYSCLPSMKAKINQHNRNVLNKQQGNNMEQEKVSYEWILP